MGFMNRAYLYVTRKRGKSVLLFIILLTMATLVLTGLSIGSASDQTQEVLRQSLGGEFTVMVDYSDSNPYFKMETVEKGTGVYVNYSTEMPITQKEIDAIKGIDGVAGYDAYFPMLVGAEEMKFIPGNIPISDEFRALTNAVIAMNSIDTEYFRSGDLELTEGGHIEPNGSSGAVISRDVAELNGLGVGDSIPLFGDEAAEVEIIGIFEVRNPESIMTSITSYDKLANKIFIDMGSWQRMIPNRPAGYDSVVFRADDPARLDAIVSEVQAISSIDWRAYLLESNNQTYLEAAAPLEQLNGLITSMLVAIAIVSALVLTLILTMWAKSRVHEIGVLLSVGIGKAAIIGQHLAEVLIIAVLSFGLSFVTSGAIADKIGSDLLERNIQTAETQDEVARAAAATLAPDGAGDTLEKPDINVAISPDSFMQLCLIGFAVIVISVGASGVTLMRLKPREILSKMS